MMHLVIKSCVGAWANSYLSMFIIYEMTKTISPVSTETAASRRCPVNIKTSTADLRA